MNKTKKEMIFLDNFKGAERKKVRENLLKILEMRKKQIEQFDKVFIEPQRKNQELVLRALKSDYPINRLMEENVRFQEYLSQLLINFGKKTEETLDAERKTL